MLELRLAVKMFGHEIVCFCMTQTGLLVLIIILETICVFIFDWK